MILVVTLVGTGAVLDEIDSDVHEITYTTGDARSIVEDRARVREMTPADALDELDGWSNGYIAFGRALLGVGRKRLRRRHFPEPDQSGLKHPGHEPQSVHAGNRRRKPGLDLPDVPKPAAAEPKPKPRRAPKPPADEAPKPRRTRKPKPAADSSTASSARRASATHPPRYSPELDQTAEGWLRLIDADGSVRIPKPEAIRNTATRRRAERNAAELSQLADRGHIKRNRQNEYVLTPAGRKALARQRGELSDAERRWVDVASPRASGADIADNVGFAEKVLAAAVPDPTTGRLAERGLGDQVALELAKAQGFDQPPQLASPDEFRRMARSGEIGQQLWRGVQEGRLRKPAAQIHQELRAGPLHIGLGTFGNGIYMATAKRHASSPEYSEKGNPLSVGHFGVRADAKVIDWEDLVAEHEQWWKATFGDGEPSGPLYEAFGDPGRWAMARGYDAISIKEGQEPGMGRAAQGDQWVVLNRSALIAEVPDGS